MTLTIPGADPLYEVDGEVAEPEPLRPVYIPPSGQARVPAAAPVAAPPARPKSAHVADESKVCRSPFSGTVSSISAQVGQIIQVNDVLMVLEAMKMETVITAPVAGKVAKIHANVGDAVQQGQVLVELE